MSESIPDAEVTSPLKLITLEEVDELADRTFAEPPIRVMALHALLYCERLFYLEEIEEIRVADGAVYAGRRLHDYIVPLDDETPERRSVEVSSSALGLFGKVDAMRRRDGRWVVLEHKRGRSLRDEQNQVHAWPSDRIQAIAYAVLLAENLGEPVPQARVRYHAENVTALIEINDAAIVELQTAVERARELRRTTQRPPVCENERLCKRCSLAPICLPEEERLATRFAFDNNESAALDLLEQKPVDSSSTPTLHPSHRERHTLHLTANRASVGRSGESLLITIEDEATRQTKKEKVPIAQIDALVVHGYGQVTTQAIHLCASHGVAVQWLTGGGKYAAGISASPGRVQQRIRQYTALSEPVTRFRLPKSWSSPRSKHN